MHVRRGQGISEADLKRYDELYKEAVKLHEEAADVLEQAQTVRQRADEIINRSKKE